MMYNHVMSLIHKGMDNINDPKGLVGCTSSSSPHSYYAPGKAMHVLDITECYVWYRLCMSVRWSYAPYCILQHLVF